MTEIGNTPNLIGNGIEKYASLNPATAETETDQAKARLESIGKEFEGVFLSLMLKEMRNTLDEGGFFGEETSDTYGGMFDMFVGQDLAETSPLGITEMLVDNFSKFQNAAIGSPQSDAKTNNAAATYSGNASTGSGPSADSDDAADGVTDRSSISFTI